MASRFALRQVGTEWEVWHVCLPDVQALPIYFKAQERWVVPACPHDMTCDCIRTEAGPLQRCLGRYPSLELAMKSRLILCEAWGEAPDSAPLPAGAADPAGVVDRSPVQVGLFDEDVPF